MCGRTQFGRELVEAGADAIELNIYDPVVDFDLSADEVERNRLDMIYTLHQTTQRPLAVKLSRTYTNLPNFAREACALGASALVLFNRLYQPDVLPEHLGLDQQVRLSTSSELGVRLRGVAALAGRIHGNLAISGGVHTAEDVIRATLAGADAVQMVSAILEKGAAHVKYVLKELQRWVDWHNYDSLSQLRGAMSLMRLPGPKAVERANYMQVLNSWKPGVVGVARG